MKIFASLAASLLVTALLLSFLPVRGENAVYEKVIRLHVLAESDRAEDQALKLTVRDAVLERITPMLEPCTDYEAACHLLMEEKDTIKAAAEETLRQNGSTCTVEVKLVHEEYPTRVYEDIALPSGGYTSLKIMIGQGAGKNWWCVLFPSVCNSFSRKADNKQKDPQSHYIAAGFTPEQYRMIQKDSTPTYKVRFKVLEMLSELFGFDY